MKLEDAIFLQDMLYGSTILDPLPRYKEAVKLGIEALNRVEDMRISPCTTADEFLPGETE